MSQLPPKLFPELKSFLIIIVLSMSVVVNAQEKDQFSIIKADTTWGKEIIKFPIDWAPKIVYKGFEELRFAPEWSNNDHEEFWTLVMSWSVETTKEIPLKELEFNLNHYFDMLMKPNHWAEEFPEPELLLSNLEMTQNGTQFKGKMTFFDGFHTGEIITTYILGSQTLCETTGKSFVIFKFSTKDFTQPIWGTLDQINLKEASCID